MKIITNDKAYIQYSNAFNLATIVSLMNLTCPPSVTSKCFRTDFVVNGDNRYAFIEFTEKDAIEFIKKIDCIVNYDELINKPEDELLEMVKDLIKNAKDVIDKYNGMDAKKQHKNYKKLHSLYHLSMYKAHSLKELILFKKGVNIYDLPVGNPQVEEEKKKEKVKKNMIDVDHHIV